MLKCSIEKKLSTFHLMGNLVVGNGELLVILGASGCGKTSLLNCIAGFTPIDSGEIELDKVFYDRPKARQHLPIHQRQIAYMQQGNTLFPHLTVRENILYSIKKKKRENVMAQYEDLLALLAIESLEDRMPKSLSGGQQQRVAIARTLMMSPKLILWDEPFSALDRLIREDLRALVLDLKKRLDIPMIFVTHDLEEAFQLADQLGVMSQGKILQIDRRDKIFNCPQNAIVGKTLGISNILKATYTQGQVLNENPPRDLVSLACGDVHLIGIDWDRRLKKVPLGSTIHVGIRPEQILYIREDMENTQPNSGAISGNIFVARVLSVVKHLDNYRLRIVIEGLSQVLLMDMPRGVIIRYDIHEGSRIQVLLKYKRIIIMDVVQLNENPNSAFPANDFMIKENCPQQVSIQRYHRMKKQSKPVVIGVAGVSNAGKTRVMESLIQSLCLKGISIGTIKHDGHGFTMDQPGKDTDRHRQAGAKRVMIASKDQYAILQQTPKGPVALDDLIAQQRGVDLIFVEGYKFSSIPKFEVVRKERADHGVCRQDSLIGFITDVKEIDMDIPQYPLHDLSDVVAVIERIVKEAIGEG